MEHVPDAMAISRESCKSPGLASVSFRGLDRRTSTEPSPIRRIPLPPLRTQTVPLQDVILSSNHDPVTVSRYFSYFPAHGGACGVPEMPAWQRLRPHRKNRDAPYIRAPLWQRVRGENGWTWELRQRAGCAAHSRLFSRMAGGTGMRMLRAAQATCCWPASDVARP